MEKVWYFFHRCLTENPTFLLWLSSLYQEYVWTTNSTGLFSDRAYYSHLTWVETYTLGVLNSISRWNCKPDTTTSIKMRGKVERLVSFCQGAWVRPFSDYWRFILRQSLLSSWEFGNKYTYHLRYACLGSESTTVMYDYALQYMSSWNKNIFFSSTYWMYFPLFD